MVTTTKIVYFRPDKRHVDNEALGSKYSCVIQDEFTSAENNICVPSYLTVFQHHTPKSRGGNVGCDKNGNSNRFLEKLCFYLVGSRQSPQLSDPLTNISTQNIDRIEFRGHIGFEEPVFDIIRQLQGLRRVSFFLSLCKQGIFETSKAQKNLAEKSCPISNHFVTNLKIVMTKCDKEKSCDCNNSDYESKDPLDARKETLRLMVIRILERSVALCPNIKRINMDVANWEGIRESIEKAITDLKELKPSNVTISKSHILVDKSSEIFHTTQPEVEANDSVSGTTLIINSEQPQCSVEIDKSEITDNDTPMVDSTCEISIGDHELPDENQENMEQTDDNLRQEEPDSAEPSTCLVDMSKLLGSMLGIPTSSKSLTQQQQLPSLPLINTPLSTCTNKNNIINASDSETNQQSSPSINDQSSLATAPTSLVPSTNKDSDCNTFSEETSQSEEKKQENGTLSSEIITYAAAAASAPAVSSISNNNYKNHTRGNGNDSHRLYRANEGSRRTFSRDVAVGSGAATSKSSAEVTFSRNHPKKPYIPHVADLGKPVFTRAPLTNRHIQQK